MNNIIDNWNSLGKSEKIFIKLILIIIIIIPWLAFVVNFGLIWSKDISAWTNTANYLNNIYSPIVSLIAVVGVFITYINQRNFNLRQIKSNKIAEFAIMEPHFKKLLGDLIEKSLRNLRNLENERHYHGTIAIPNIIQTKGSFIQYLKLIDGYYNFSKNNYFKIINRISDYEFMEKPNVIFEEEISQLKNVFRDFDMAFKRILIIVESDDLTDEDFRELFETNSREEVIKKFRSKINDLIFFYQL